MSTEIDHVSLRDGWRAWRDIELRSAGFAAAQVLRVAATDSSAEVTRLIETEDRAALARQSAIDACLHTLGTTLAPPSRERKAVKHVLKQLRLGMLPRPGIADDALAALRAIDAELAQQRAAAIESLARDTRRISDELRAIALDPRFREAVLWQNRSAVHNALDWLVRQPEGASSAKARQSEQLIARYLQRYCVKNDTIGFFGPDGWARLGDGDGVAVRPGGGLLAARRVYFEHWCIDALASALAEDPELRLDLAPRRLPAVRLEGSTLHYPIAKKMELDREYVAVIGACDGVTSARVIAAALADELELTPEGVYELLDELVGQRVLRWAFDIPTATREPERYLAEALARMPGTTARDAAVGALDEITAARAATESAAGDPIALERALEALDTGFEARTRTSASRRAGAMYAARTLVYEDTRRDLEVTLGTSFVERIAAPLTLLATSARWYSHEVAAGYRGVFHTVFEALCAKTGGTEVDYLQYLNEVLPHLAVDQYEIAPTVRAVVDEHHARWASLLAIEPGVRRVERSIEALLPVARTLFAAPRPGWPLARYHCPDLMVSAASVDAFARGEYTCVVGEVHVGFHTYVWPTLVNHADPSFLVPALQADLGRPLVAVVEPRASALQTNRVHPVPEDLDIELGDARSWRPPQQVLAAAQLLVSNLDGRLVVRTRDGQHVLDLVAVLESYIVMAAATHFGLFARAAHVPRVTIDHTVIHRESWQFSCSELAFAQAIGIDRITGVRRWAAAQGLPRFVFARVAEEPKPCFVDLESPIYVDLLARLVRKSSTIAISEMLPTLDHTWLPDAAGNTYTAELRIALVDPRPWQP